MNMATYRTGVFAMALNLAAAAAFTPAADCASAESDSWVRPRTTRRYLHPPMAECMFTLCNDGKIVRGENVHRHDWGAEYGELIADVIWVLHGADDKPFDFKAAENLLPEDGAPFHGLAWHLGDMSIRMDAFCETGVRNPACFLRLTFSCDVASEIREPIAMHLRRMAEADAIKGAPDIYESYETRLEPFLGAIPSGFRPVGPNAWASEKTTVCAEGLPPDAHWDEQRGAIRFIAAPRKDVPLVVTFAMTPPGSPMRPSDWDCAQEKAKEFWLGELARLNRLPPQIATDPGKLRLVRNLTVQMLQCFCHAVGSNLTLPRQGGLQRYVWPWDCKYMLAALGRMGDFGEYVEGALDFYFREYASDTGRIGPFRNKWMCDTGECIHSLARYCLDTGNRAVWDRHRDAAMRGFDWIRKVRAEPPTAGGVAGLFPIGSATDNATPIQFWCFTDMLTLDALGAFAEAARRFGDSRATEVEAERDALRSVLARIYGGFSMAAAEADELRIPLTPDGNDEALREAGYFDTMQGYALHVGLDFGFAPVDDVMKVYTWHLRNGKADPRGLCANHPPLKNLSGRHVWYTTASDMYWHRNFLRIGRHDLADRVWNATLCYAMSPEYCVNERYRDDDPWYSPWNPNASGSGRVLLMLLDRCRASSPAMNMVSMKEDGLLPMVAGTDRYYAKGATVVQKGNGCLELANLSDCCTLTYDWLPGLPRWRGFGEITLKLDKPVPGGKVILRLRDEKTKRIFGYSSTWTKEVRFSIHAEPSEYWYFVSLTFEFPVDSNREGFTIIGMYGTRSVPAAEAFSLDVDTGDPLHVMAPGGKSAAIIRNLADRRLRLDGTLQLRDFWGNGPDMEVSRELAAGETVRLPMDVPDRMGIWRVNGVFEVEGSAATQTVAFAVLEPRGITPQWPRGEFRFGVNCHMDKYSEGNRELCGHAMVRIGAKLARCDLFSPEAICPEEGVFNWEKHEVFLREMERFGVSLHAIIYGCPRWACWKAEPHDHKYYCAMRSGVFEEYCRMLSSRYGTRIAYYEIGNEWDMAPAEQLPDEQAIAMQREAMRGLHAGCGDVVCIPNGWASGPYSRDKRRSAMQREMIGNNQEAYDAYAIHCHGEFKWYVPEIRSALAFLKEKGVDKPWYSDESALSSARGMGEEAARTVWKKIAFAWSHGSIDYIWYNLRGTGFDQNNEEHGYGLFTGDFYPRAGAASFSALAGLLGHLRFAELLEDGDERLVGKWTGMRDGRSVDVYVGWDISGEHIPFPIPVPSGIAATYDLMGNISSVEAKDGYVEWPLSADPSAVIIETGR